MKFSEWTRCKRKLNDLNSLKRDIVSQFKERDMLDEGIVVMASGGKDSSTAIALARDIGLNIRYLIHFYHRWSWEISKNMVMALSEKYNIPAVFFDITDEILKRTRGAKGSSICRICKNIMKDKTVDFAREKGIKIIMTGDSALEKVSGAVMNYLRERYGEVKYDKMELTPVPQKYSKTKEILFFRPLIRLSYDDVLRLTRYYNIKVEKSHEVGDKIGFWREGCCLQYADENATLNEELFNNLYKYNKLATETARKYGFRASIKLPSKRIMVVPEKEEYLTLIKNALRDIDES
ncbi:Queuosine synthesis-like protein [Methanocaldococcus vulcanius M7]|uniref:Queuosine synthesis-like protein n=1 Tax=Methanocaldococcus vulcanius (strain ATCC 700851 / DSM 12094 / M7) TaxID=579137 RepID=C9RI80_METVM|nr:phosphoadenosine phosphosulfate reductase family protein [Methanocaldococcus vulcanius]ACX73282.1 Queuosine synthesis-like protein [Methanocaldococcus vulcanius M7]